MTVEIALEAYRPSDRDGYLRLLREAWGEGAFDAQTYDWWFDGSPHGSLRTVGVRDGEVVAAGGHSLVRLRVGERELLAQFSLNAVTTPSAQGLGLFRRVERQNEQEGAARGSIGTLAFASAPVRPILAGPLGFSQVDRRRIWGRPLRGIGGRLRRTPPDRPRGGSLPAGVRRVARLDVEAERAYREAAPSLGVHIVRDLAHLEWRYALSPRGYRLLQVEGGFAVVGTRLHRGVHAGLILDLFARPAVAPTLIRACVATLAEAEVLLAVPTPTLPRALLARHGFAPTPLALDLMGKSFDDGSLPLDSASWTITLGDTDFF